MRLKPSLSHALAWSLMFYSLTALYAAERPESKSVPQPLIVKPLSNPSGVTGIERPEQRPDGSHVIRDRVAGSGTIKGNETYIYQGIISPGHSPGCISNQGSVVFDATSVLILEIGGSTPCAGYDQFSIGQKLTVNGATLQIVLLNDYVPTPGQTFQLLQWATQAGTFGAIDTSLAPLPNGQKWDFTSLYSNGSITASSVVSSSSTSVPIPAWAEITLAIGLMTLSIGVKRRRIGC